MSGRGTKRGHVGDAKEWLPFSGRGHRLGDDRPGAPDMEIGGVGKTPLGDGSQTMSPQRAVTSPGQASTSPGSGSRGSCAEICSPIVDLETEPDNTCEYFEHPEWAGMVCMPTTAEWRQKASWTLADLVLDSVQSQVFAHGDFGRNLIPGALLEAFRNDESPSCMVSVLKTCALAVLKQNLHVLGQGVTNDLDLPVVADHCLLEGLITPIQHKYCIFLDQHSKKTLSQ